jgi:hypothetical protein
MRGNRILHRLIDVIFSVLFVTAALASLIKQFDLDNIVLTIACGMYAYVSIGWYRETYHRDQHVRSIDTTAWLDVEGVDFHSIGVVDDKSTGSPRREMVLYVDRQSNMFVMERNEFEKRHRLAEACECDDCKKERGEQ